MKWYVLGAFQEEETEDVLDSVRPATNVDISFSSKTANSSRYGRLGNNIHDDKLTNLLGSNWDGSKPELSSEATGSGGSHNKSRKRKATAALEVEAHSAERDSQHVSSKILRTVEETLVKSVNQKDLSVNVKLRQKMMCYCRSCFP